MLEFFILGPYSFVEMTADGIPFHYFLANNFFGNQFSHFHSGGQDIFSIHVGAQYFQIEKLLLSVLPVWVANLLHKLTVLSVGFWGSFALLHHSRSVSYSLALGLSALFTVSHTYLGNYSFAFGAGFAVIPLVAYLCIAELRKRSLFLLFVLCILLVASANIIKIFPPMLVVLVGICILYNNVRYSRVLSIFFALAVVSALNWSEVLYGLYKVTPLTTRLGSGPLLEIDIFQWFNQMGAALVGHSVALPIILFSLALLFIRTHQLFVRATLCFLWIIISFWLVKVFPWDIIGLGLFKHLEHGYQLISLEVLALPIAGAAISTKRQLVFSIGQYKKRIIPATISIAVACSILMYDKSFNLAQLFWFGGQAHYWTYKELMKDKWKPKDNYRVVTLFDSPNPNIISGFYGFEAFDGQANVILKSWGEYWQGVLRWSPVGDNMTRVRKETAYWKDQQYDIDSQLDIDLLGIANVRYIFSPLPLKSKKLRLLFKPAEKDTPLAFYQDFDSILSFINFRIRRIFDSGELFIYEVKNFLPRIYTAHRFLVEDRQMERGQYYEDMKNAAFGRKPMLPDHTHEHTAEGQKLKIIRYSKHSNGYDIDVTSQNGGTLVVNQTYTPFWKALADGVPAKINSINVIQMAITVPTDTKTIRLLYSRPTFFDKLSSVFN
ncbi:MAG: hypothetical protein VX617_04425 [Pseudomonadota bacterium]|nr:hypothetical protein [Pseudomonadota bacterium]